MDKSASVFAAAPPPADFPDPRRTTRSYDPLAENAGSGVGSGLASSLGFDVVLGGELEDFR